MTYYDNKPESYELWVCIDDLPDPFEIWPWLPPDVPLTLKEVTEAIAENRFVELQYEGPSYGFFEDWDREKHIGRVAFFCMFGWDPIDVEVSIDGEITLLDGHHRVAAARYLGHQVMDAIGGGYIDELDNLHKRARKHLSANPANPTTKYLYDLGRIQEEGT